MENKNNIEVNEYEVSRGIFTNLSLSLNFRRNKPYKCVLCNEHPDIFAQNTLNNSLMGFGLKYRIACLDKLCPNSKTSFYKLPDKCFENWNKKNQGVKGV